MTSFFMLVKFIHLYFCFFSLLDYSFNCWFDSREYQKCHSPCRSFNISREDFLIDKACELSSHSDLPLDSILLFKAGFYVSEGLLFVEVLVLCFFNKVENFESFLIINVWSLNRDFGLFSLHAIILSN